MNPLLLDAAAAELRAAAILADSRADGDPLSAWTAFAGQLRLVAASIDPAPQTTAPTRPTPAEHTAAALDGLNQLDQPGEGPDPEDLEFWRRHVEHLHERAGRLVARSGTRGAW